MSVFLCLKKNVKKYLSTYFVIKAFIAPKNFSFGLMVSCKNWCDWAYEIEPTAAGCRVTHSWVDYRGSIADRLGKVISGVGDRSVHNRVNMEITLENLAKAAEAS